MNRPADLDVEEYRGAVAGWEHHDTMINQTFPLILTGAGLVVVVAFAYLGSNPIARGLILLFGGVVVLNFTIVAAKLKVYADAYAKWADTIRPAPFTRTDSVLAYLGKPDKSYFDRSLATRLLAVLARQRAALWYISVGFSAAVGLVLGSAWTLLAWGVPALCAHVACQL